MSRFIPEKIRLQVAEKAKFRCEYCLIHEDDLILKCQIDHIISLKHEGPTALDNLAYSCLICNSNKGSDVGTFLLPNQSFIRFFNPRKDQWADHFELSGAYLIPKTEIGEATVKIFQFNTPERIARREFLIAAGRYLY